MLPTDLTARLTFQSHCGAIATPKVSVNGKEVSATFNPTVVRLRPKSEEEETLQTFAFNPTVVRLRHEDALALSQLEEPFNPTVVRLRR